MADRPSRTTVCELPELPRKAKPRPDQHGFREQGTKIADDRVKKLRTQINNVDESQKKRRRELDQLALDAKQELEEARKVEETGESLSSGQSENLKQLHKQVVDQVQETKLVLSQMLQDLAGEAGLADKEGPTTITKAERRNKQVENLRRTLMRWNTDLEKLRESSQSRQKNASRIQKQERKISQQKKQIKSLQRQQKDDEEEDSEDEEIREQKHKKQLQKKGAETESFTLQHKARKAALRDLGQSISDIQYGTKDRRFRSPYLSMGFQDRLYDRTHPRGHQRRGQFPSGWGNSKSLMHQGDRAHRRKSSLSRGFYGDNDVDLGSDAGSDSEPDSPGTVIDADTVEDEQYLGILERLVNVAKTLEVTYIHRIQEHREEIDDFQHLGEALDAEIRLETKWLKQQKGLKGVNILQLGSQSTSHLSDQHFSGRSVTGIYKPLREGEFRVLVVLPAPEPYYPLICKLETWETASQLKYAALSYFWGPEVHNGRIFLLSQEQDSPSPLYPGEWGRATRHATRIPIRNNLFRALLRLRRSGTKAQPIALWVDFMCINQEDTSEKTEQLSRMVDIYSTATNVCIWLGESDSQGRSDDAMKFISTTMDFAVLDRHAHDKTQAKRWFALGELMRDRWFSRRWVVQEIALAKDATVHCGGLVVRWAEFADAASLLISHQENIKCLFEPPEWREGHKTLGDINFYGASILLEALNNLFRRQSNGDIKKPIKSIESLVTSLKTFDTGDRRDLIYSLVYIANDTSYHVWRHDRPRDRTTEVEDLKVDYNRSELAVYTDFVRFCVLSSKSLDIICRPWAMQLKSVDELDELPSWIPLLSTAEFGIPEEVYRGRKNGQNLVGPAGASRYEASDGDGFEVTFETKGDAASDYFFRDIPMVLCARGFRFAIIQEVSPQNTGGVILRGSLRMGGWKGFEKDTDGVPDPIWRTLVADRDQEGRVPPSWYQRACLRCLEIADTFNNGDLNVGELLQGEAEMLRKYLERVRNVTWNRRFFTASFVQAEDTEEKLEEDEPIKIPLEERDLDQEVDKQFENGINGGEDGREMGYGDEIQESEILREGEEERSDEDETERGGGVEAYVEDDSATQEGKGTDLGKEKEMDGEEEKREKEEARNMNQVKDEEGYEGAKGQEAIGEEDANSKHANMNGVTKGTERKAGGREGVNAVFTEDLEDDMGDEEDENRETSFGLCPPRTKEGDIICILHGCSVPVVLRPTADGMELVGEAYVHGIMDGEALEGFRDRGSKGGEPFRIL